jgi:hypothetical protein
MMDRFHFVSRFALRGTFLRTRLLFVQPTGMCFDKNKQLLVVVNDDFLSFNELK